ncbi:MAG: hypothetical protein HQ582_07300, partial [Planctomycetes bacterium]|nr:hypothetical protein [Planctomycetota bacterium]
MPRTWNRTCCCVALLAITVLASSARAANPSETLLPASTKGYLSITDTDVFSEHWDQTQLGQLMNDPTMKPFTDDLERQMRERSSDLRERLGITIDELETVPGRDVSVARLLVAEDQSALVLLSDVTDRLEDAQAFLKTVAANLVKEGAKQSSTTLAGAPALQFDLPIPPKAQPRKGEKAPKPDQTFYLVKDNLLAGADSLEVIQGILARQAGGPGETLADVAAFRAVMERCKKDVGEKTPQVRWFLEPFGYDKASQAALPEEERTQGKSTLDQLEAAGFDAVQGGGGFLDVGVDGYEVFHRTVIYAPKPHEKSMKMLALSNEAQPKLPSWIPRDVATCTVIYGDMLTAFDNIGPLFDEVAGEGEEGIWADTVESLRMQEDGPKIDLREELFKYQNNQVILLTDYQLPITTTSERLIIAVAVTDSDAVARAMKKTQSIDEAVRRREFEGHVIWETVPREKVEVPKVELDAPPLDFLREEEYAEDEAEPLLPNQALCVANGYLLIASHYDFLTKVLQPINARETLGRSIDYRIVEATIKRLAPEANCVYGFSRTDQEYRPTYELMRQGK